MRLKKVTLNNYRCFEHLELDLHPRLTVLVGENGAGKTAVLDGIATGLSPVLTYLSTANQRLTGRGIKDDDFRLLPVDVNQPQISRVADYSQVVVETWSGWIWDHWKPSIQGREPVVKHGTSELRQKMLALLESFETATPALLPVFAYYGTQAQTGYGEVPLRLHKTKNNYAYPTSALLDSLSAVSDFKEALKWFDQEEIAELRVNKNNRGSYAEFFEESRALGLIRSAISALLCGQYSDPAFGVGHKFTVRGVNGNTYRLTQLSQGYHKMMALAMDFSRRLALAGTHITPENIFSEISEDPIEKECWGVMFKDALEHPDGWNGLCIPSIMLVDEIDLHLHPTWQQRVLDDLMRTFPLTQFIVTTHSPQVLSTVKRECIRILRQTETGYEAVLPDFSPLAHESGEALARVMGTHNPPSSPLLDKVHEFEQLVLAGQESSERAQALHQELDQAGYQFMDSDLHTWRVLAKHRASKLKA